jgi:SAM-dependent methyltransferase
MPLTRIFGAQCRKPSGWLGQLMGSLMNWRHQPLSRWTIELMDIQPHDSVLDIGCGGGMTIKEMARIATGGFVAGVDYSEVMVRQALKCNAATVGAGLVAITTAWSKEMDNHPKYAVMAQRMHFPLYAGSEMVAMLTAAGFSKVQFRLKDGRGWLCAVGVK